MSGDRIIYKHVIYGPGAQIPLGPNDRILTAATQDETPCVWVEHALPIAASPMREVRAVGTGRQPEPGETYIGTCHNVAGAGLVFHLYLGAER